MSDVRDPWDALWDLIYDRLPESDLIKLGSADDFVEAIREAGWRPPAQVITTADDLDALPDLSIVVIPNGLAVQRWTGDGQAVWIGASDSLVMLTSRKLISIWREVTLLHVPTEKADTE